VKESIKVSPDGKKFFFTLNFNPMIQTSQDAIYSCNIDGSGLTKLVDNIGEFSDAK
jgi:Tol biopolymer transport system component